MNILVIGSDTREGQGKAFGEVAGARSDTTMLVHLNAGHTRAAVVSIPRDLLVTIPECEGRPAHVTRFNAAFSEGGVKCTIRTVKSLTGLPVDHVVVVDFKGMKQMVNSLGGLEVCLAYPMKDDKAGLDLPKGPQTLNGKDALALARARYELGNGSDIDRISRQQQLLQAFINQLSDSGTLKNPITLYSVADAALSSLSVDDGLNETHEIVAFLSPLANLPSGSVEMVTYPWTWSPGMATVDIDQGKAEVLNGKLARDELPMKKAKKSKNPQVAAGNPSEDGPCSNPIG